MWLKCWSAPLENAVMKNKRRGSAKMPAIRLRVNHDFPMYVLDFFSSPIKKSTMDLKKQPPVLTRLNPIEFYLWAQTTVATIS
jgi:hypothetical protein